MLRAFLVMLANLIAVLVTACSYKDRYNNLEEVKLKVDALEDREDRVN